MKLKDIDRGKLVTYLSGQQSHRFSWRDKRVFVKQIHHVLELLFTHCALLVILCSQELKRTNDTLHYRCASKMESVKQWSICTFCSLLTVYAGKPKAQFYRITVVSVTWTKERICVSVSVSGAQYCSYQNVFAMVSWPVSLPKYRVKN